LTANLADQDAELERQAEAMCLELGKEKMNSDVLQANRGTSTFLTRVSFM